MLVGEVFAVSSQQQVRLQLAFEWGRSVYIVDRITAVLVGVWEFAEMVMGTEWYGQVEHFGTWYNDREQTEV
jgi:hypothetical protein